MEINHVDRVEAAYRQIHPRLWRALYAYAGDREIATDAEALGTSDGPLLIDPVTGETVSRS